MPSSSVHAHHQSQTNQTRLTDQELSALFGKWRGDVEKAIHEIDGFEDFLRVELKSVGPSFITACMILGSAHLATRKSRRVIFLQIMTEKRTVLLRQLSGCKWTRPGVIALRKMDMTEAEDFDIGILGQMCIDPLRGSILRRVDFLTPTMLRAYRHLPNWLCNFPCLLRALTEPGIETMLETRLGRSYRNPPEALREKMGRSLSRIRNLDVRRWLDHWGMQVLKHEPFPEPPFQGDDLLQPLASINAMCAEARTMQNCLNHSHSIFSVLSGHTYFYRWLGDERATVSVTKSRDTDQRPSWKLGAVAGFDNSDVNPLTESEVENRIPG